MWRKNYVCCQEPISFWYTYTEHKQNPNLTALKLCIGNLAVSFSVNISFSGGET